MNLEEIKIKLTNQFSDVNNSMVELFLKYSKELEDVEYLATEHFGNLAIKYLPLYLPEHNLLMDISHYRSLERGYHYRNIVFVERNGEYSGCKKLDIRTDISYRTNPVIRVDIRETTVEFLSVQHLMGFDKKYQLGVDGYIDRPIAVFDVGDGSWYWEAQEFEYNGFHFLSRNVDPLFNLDEWKQSVETGSNTYDYFKDRAEKVNLKEVFSEGLAGGARLLSFYSKHKNIEHFLRDELWGIKLRRFLYESITDPIIITTMEQEFNFSETSIPGILNVPEYFIELNEEVTKDNNWFLFNQIINEFKKLKKIIGFDTKDEYAIVIKLLGHKPDSEYLPALSYLIKTGYGLHELEKYLLEVNKNQSTPIRIGLNRLFYVVNGREILTGKREVYIPKNLTQEYRLMKQTLGSKEIVESSLVRDNFIQKKEYLVTKRPILEIVGKDYPYPDTMSAEQLQSATDSLYLKKVKNKKYFELKIIGDVIFCPNMSMGSLYFNHFFKWAEENNLYVSYNKQKRITLLITKEQV